MSKLDVRMERYRVKPAEVEAFQWFQKMGTEVKAPMRQNMDRFEVHTINDVWFPVEDGDWLVKDQFGIWVTYKDYEFPEAFEKIK